MNQEAAVISEQITKISSVSSLDDASITALNLELTAKNYSHLLEKTNNIDDLTREILNEWNITDKANYFNDATKIAEAKAYASYLLNDTVVE
jgi:hypothetical protein